jgi:hypothetical protein
MSNVTQDLVQQGLTAARVGDPEEARRLLTQATLQYPDNIEAWLGLAGVVDSLDYKRECFNKVLAIESDNAEAQAGLELLDRKQAKNHSDIPTPDIGLEPEFIGTGPSVCYRHPEIETGLRCNKCGNFICTKCAKRTPVGFRCPDCIREQEDKYYTGGNLDYVIAAVVALPLSLVAGWAFTFILGGFGFFTLIIAFFAAPFVAGLIAESVRWAVGRRRSRYLRHIVIAALVLGTAPFALVMLLSGAFFGLITPAMLMFIGAATISARLR